MAGAYPGHPMMRSMRAPLRLHRPHWMLGISPGHGEGELVPGVVRSAGTDCPLKLDAPPLLSRGLAGTGLCNRVAARVIGLSARGEPLIAARGIILCFGGDLRRLCGCMPAFLIGASR